jgi:hypothetical protein
MKRRDEEDFRELGAYLQVARDALLSAEVKALNMYPQRQGPGRRIEEQRHLVDDLRRELDSTWIHDVNAKAHVPGPDPIFGCRYRAEEQARKANTGIREEAERNRRDRNDWSAA